MMSHQSLRMRAAERRHRDRINVYGAELLGALQALAPWAARAIDAAAGSFSNSEWNDACNALDQASALIAKLEDRK